jgi:hypothetical protein
VLGQGTSRSDIGGVGYHSIFNLDRGRKVVRDMSLVPYPGGRIKEQIILYVTEKNEHCKKYRMYTRTKY